MNGTDTKTFPDKTMGEETIAEVTAECGDVMLAKECIADLNSARFRGQTSLDLPHSADELEAPSYFGYGSPIGETSARGALIGGLLGLPLAAIASSLPIDWPLADQSLAVLVGSLSAGLGGLIGFLSGRRSLEAVGLLDCRRN